MVSMPEPLLFSAKCAIIHITYGWSVQALSTEVLVTIEQYPLASDVIVRHMAAEGMRRFRRAQLSGEISEKQRVKPFLLEVLHEEKGCLDPTTEREYLAAMGHLLACRPRRPRSRRSTKPLSVPELADKVEGILAWLKKQDGERLPSHFMQAVNMALKKNSWRGDRQRIHGRLIGELGKRSAKAAAERGKNRAADSNPDVPF